MTKLKLPFVSLFIFLGISACVALDPAPGQRPPARTVAGTIPPAMTSTRGISGTMPLTATATVTGMPTMSVTATITATSIATATSVVTTTPTITGTITPTGTAVPTSTVVPTRTVVPTPTRTKSPTKQPTATPTSTPTSTPTTQPSTPTPLPPAPPTREPDPKTVNLLNHRSYREGESLFVVGEVYNGQTFPVYSVKIVSTFYNSSGARVAAQESLAFLPMSEPGLANPFKLELTNASAEISRYELDLAWEEISIVEYTFVTVASQQFEEEEDTKEEDEEGVTIVGEMQNEHDIAVNSIQVVITLFNDDWDVIDVMHAEASTDTLAPNEGGTFRLDVPAEIEFKRFDVQVQGVMALF